MRSWLKKQRVPFLLAAAAAAVLIWTVGCPTGGGPAGTFSISGRVTHAVTGDGIQGVTITVDGRQATTAATGNYSVTGLEAGTYTVTPTFQGLTFSPANRSVTVGPNQVNVDFTAGATVLQVRSVSTAPTGIDDAVWQTVAALQVQLDEGINVSNQSGGQLYGDGELNMTGTFNGLTDFNDGSPANLSLKAVHTSTDLFILAEWDDSEFNVDRRRWLFDGPTDPLKPNEAAAGWTSQLNDDKIAFAWAVSTADQITSSVAGQSQSFATRGCMASCHTTPSGLDMRPGQGTVDIWHWKTSRSEPLGFVNDQVSNETTGRTNDSGQAIENRNRPQGGNNRSGPAVIWDGTTQTIPSGPRQGSTLDPAVILLTGHTVSIGTASADRGKTAYQNSCSACHGATGGGGAGPALNTLAIARTSNATLSGDTAVGSHPGAAAFNALPSIGSDGAPGQDDLLLFVRGFAGIPGYSLTIPDGSNADVTTDSNLSYTNFTSLTEARTEPYRLMIRRALSTGNGDDAQFTATAGQQSVFGVALMDNDGKNHVGSNYEVMEFAD